MKTKIFLKCACIAVVCYALVVFVRCANEATEVTSVEQSNRVALESFFAKLQANDFSVIDEIVPETFSSEEAKVKAKEAILKYTSAEKPPVLDRSKLLQGYKYLEKHIKIGADGRFELSGKVDYQEIISDATLTVEERKAEIAILYITEFVKPTPDNTNTAKIKAINFSTKISQRTVACTSEEYISILDVYLDGMLSQGGAIGDLFQETARIVYELYYIDGYTEEEITIFVIEVANTLPQPLSDIMIIF